MSSPYFEPAAIVQQEFVTLPSGDIRPQHCCIIGPHVKVFDADDVEDRLLINYGAYDPSQDTEYAYASLPTGAIVKLDSVKLRMEDILARYATLSGANVIERGSQANYINIPSGNGFKDYTNPAGTEYVRNSVFKKRDVKIGDRVKIVANDITLKSRITGFVHDDVAAVVGDPTATTNPSTVAYSGSVAATENMDTDHVATIDTDTTSYIGDITKGIIDDVYALECTVAGSPGTKQVETATVASAIGGAGAGNVSVVLTSALVTGSPLTTSVAVANSDTAAQVGGKIRTALGLVSAITDHFTISGSNANVVLTAKLAAANDSTLNLALNAGTTDMTAAPTSVNTTAGVAGTARFKVTSDTGDNVASVVSVGFDAPFDIGTRGLRGSIASTGVEDFIVGEIYTFTVVAGYTREAPTRVSSASTYTGAFDTVYKLEVVKGGLWSEKPQIVVTTSTGIDAGGPVVVDHNVSFLVGNYGITAKFPNNLSSTQGGLVLGDVYYITAAAATKGAVRTAVLAHPIDSSIVAGDDLEVDFYIYKESMDIPTRGYPEFASLTLDPEEDVFTVSQGIVIQDATWLENDGVTLGDLPVEEATLFVPYQALITSEAGVLRSLSDLSAVNAILGKTVKENPLGLGVQKALQNSAGQPVYFLSVATDDLEGYQDALEALEANPTPYFRVPMTGDEAILDIIESHINAEASDERGNRCMGIFATPLENFIYKYNKKEDGDNWTGYVSVEPGSSPAIYTRVTVPGATFITDGIRSNDEFRTSFGVDAYGNPTYSTALITQIIDEENLVLKTPGFSEAVGADDDLQQIQIVRNLTKDEMADLEMNRSEAFANRRIANVMVNMPMDMSWHFVAAAVAGFASSTVPHQPLTNYTLEGFSDQDGTFRRFTPTQLNRMASGGTLIVTQSVAEGQVYIRHQLTTDRTDDRRAEMSITRNVDSVSDYFLQGIKPFIGKYNISEHFIQLLDVGIRQRADWLVANRVTATAGSQLVSWDPASLKIIQNPVARTEVDIELDANFPYPANRIKLKLRVVG